MTHLFWAVIMRDCDTSCKLKQPHALQHIHLPRKQPAACMSYSYPLHLTQLIFSMENMTFHDMEICRILFCRISSFKNAIVKGYVEIRDINTHTHTHSFVTFAADFKWHWIKNEKGALKIMEILGSNATVFTWSGADSPKIQLLQRLRQTSIPMLVVYFNFPYFLR